MILVSIIKEKFKKKHLVVLIFIIILVHLCWSPIRSLPGTWRRICRAHPEIAYGPVTLTMTSQITGNTDADHAPIWGEDEISV